MMTATEAPTTENTIFSERVASMFGLELDTWNSIRLWGLGLAAVAAAVGATATYAGMQLQEAKAKASAAALEKYKISAALEIAQAAAGAASANERAAALEARTAELKRDAEQAKAEAAKANQRILEMKRMRRLETSDAEGLRSILSSDAFKVPRLCINVGSVVEAEAMAFAMDFIRLFRSCGISVYAPGGFPAETIVSGPPSPHGLLLKVNSTAAPLPAFVALQRFLHEIGLSSEVQSDPTLQPATLSFVVASKPDA